MRCYVPFCKNTSDNVSTLEAKGISFHGFPSEVHLRAAWLRALGKQDSNLLDSAVVCSQHFLNDDIYETESGLKQIRTGAIPSTVQVCMICLETDCKLILMSKHKLEEAYEKLTGHTVCNQGNLKQLLCSQCAHRLVNFSRFRDKSLRAHALMMDLVEKHEIITRRHIKMIDRTKHQLTSNMVLTTLGPDHCDLHILENPSEDEQIKLEETEHSVVVKTEGSDYSMLVDEDMIDEDDNLNDLVQDSLKYESAPFHCTICLKEFVHELAYMHHMTKHLQNGDGDGECDTSQERKPHTAENPSSSHSSLITENKHADPSPAAYAAHTLVAHVVLATNHGDVEHPTDTNDDWNISNFESKRNIVEASRRSQDTVSKESLAKPSASIDTETTRRNDLFINKQNSQAVLGTRLGGCTDQIQYICEICQKIFTRKSSLVSHIRAHTDANTPSCHSRESKLTHTSALSRRATAHTGDKRFVCHICDYRSTVKCNLVRHMKTHTGEMSLAKKYKCTVNSSLVRHKRTYTGEKPYVCKLCDYKCTQNSHLVLHMRTHSGEKPYVCKLCDYKCTQNSHLVLHMRTHSGEKPYVCKLCDYKCTVNSSLVRHMKIHTGEKPYMCKLCDYKCTVNSHLVNHMRTHSGEKPYMCKLCDYKCTVNSHLVNHMRTHSGEKPYVCKLCDYKCTVKGHLVLHMRTHTGEKPYMCKLCDYKCTQNSSLVRHMKIHTGEKPYMCKLCDYKCTVNSNLVNHMRTHSGEKPYMCKLCDYKCTVNSSLIRHMKIHTGE